MANETGLSVVQVYKWGWDQKKKDDEENDKPLVKLPAEALKMNQATRKRPCVSKP